MSLLDFAEDVLAEIGLLMPPKLFGSADLTARRVVAAAKAEGQHLYRAHNWSILHREHAFKSVAFEENYAVPDDFGRIQQRTVWDLTTYWALRGSLTPQQWQRADAVMVPLMGLGRYFRLIVGPLAGSILLEPAPTTTGDELIYEYISRDWCEDASGNSQSTWLADTDELRLDHEVFRLGLLWRVKRSVGQAYADERNNAVMALRDARIADMGLEDGNLVSTHIPPLPALPEGSWNA